MTRPVWVAAALWMAAMGAGCRSEAAAELRAPLYRQTLAEALSEDRELRHTENFAVSGEVATPDDRELFDAVCQDVEILRRAYEDRFGLGAELRAVSEVRLYSDYDVYLAGGVPRGSAGRWIGPHNRLEVARLPEEVLARRPFLRAAGPLQTLYHEGLHQYLWFACGGIAPAPWLGEGYGEVFAGSVVDRRRGTVARIEANALRLGLARTAAQHVTGEQLEVLLRMEPAAFMAGPRVQRHYALAWGICWLFESERVAPVPAPWAALPDRYLGALRKHWGHLRQEVTTRSGLHDAQDRARAHAIDEATEGLDFDAMAAALRASFRQPAADTAAPTALPKHPVGK